jgi:hypothetical protein
MEYDFSKLMIPVNVTTKDILLKYPHLTKYPEFKANMHGIDIDKAIIFTVLVYDTNGLSLYIDDIIKKRNEAATIAEFTKEGKGYKKEYQEIILWQNEQVNAMGLRYSRIQRNPYIMQLNIYEEQLFIELQNLNQGGLEADDRKRIHEIIAKISPAIQTLRTQIFLGDNSQAMLFELLESLDEEDLNELRPESIALKRRLKQDMLKYNPYEIT